MMLDLTRICGVVDNSRFSCFCQSFNRNVDINCTVGCLTYMRVTDWTMLLYVVGTISQRQCPVVVGQLEAEGSGFVGLIDEVLTVVSTI